MKFLILTLQEIGNVPHGDMYRTFNMGIGYVVVVRKKDAEKTLKMLPDAKVIGEIVTRKSVEHQVEWVF